MKKKRQFIDEYQMHAAKQLNPEIMVTAFEKWAQHDGPVTSALMLHGTVDK